MQVLVTANAMREIDSLAVKRFHIPEMILMEHAAMALAGSLASRFGRSLGRTRGIVFAGPGNNGADAIAVARMLWINGQRGISIVITPETKASPMWAAQMGMAKQLGIPFLKDYEAPLAAADWVLDGIFGVGLSRAPEGVFNDWITAINGYAGRKFILAIDVPSGMDATTGQILSNAVRASRTVTLGFAKTGLVTGQALDHVGGLTVAPIQIPRDLSDGLGSAYLLDAGDIRAWLPKRERDSHKGSFGKVSVIAGDHSMIGAATLSCLGSLRAGAGLTELVAADSKSLDRSLFAQEVVLSDQSKWQPGSSVVVIGPGLGTGGTAKKILEDCLRSKAPLVIDADALTLISEMPAGTYQKLRAGHETLFTPHPKEAARLLDNSVEEVQRDRYRAAQALSEMFGATILLKGAGTILAEKGKPLAVVPTGDAGLAKGGTGDVLAGVAAGFMAQGAEPFAAASAASFLHGKASEILTQRHGHTYSTLAHEVANTISDAIGEL